MKILWFTLVLPLLVSCQSYETAAVSSRPASRSVATTASPFAGQAPRSAPYVPPQRYYAFGGGYSSSPRQLEGDEVNFLRYSDTCRQHCGHHGSHGCGYSSWGSSCYRCSPGW